MYSDDSSSGSFCFEKFYVFVEICEVGKFYFRSEGKYDIIFHDIAFYVFLRNVFLRRKKLPSSSSIKTREDSLTQGKSNGSGHVTHHQSDIKST